MKSEKNNVKVDKNPTKDSNSKKVASDSENTKIAKEAVENESASLTLRLIKLAKL